MDGTDADAIRRAMAAPGALGRGELARLLSLRTAEDRAALRAAALEVRRRHTGNAVFLRGLVEIGNSCGKDCLYCGLRRSNAAVHRYAIPEVDAIRMAKWSCDSGYGSVVFQSGEIQSEGNTDRIERIVRAVRADCGPDFAIVLSLGEQSRETYARWREAGADR